MNLQAFDAADNAVKKIVKDYKPVTDLAVALEEIRVQLIAVGDLAHANKQAKADLAGVQADKAKADGELRFAKEQIAKEQAVLDRVRQAVSAIKQNLSQG